MLNNLLLLILGFFISVASADIIESDDILSVLNHIEPTVLVLFDIDNTLIKTKHTLAQETCFNYIYKEFLNSGLTREHALVKSVGIFNDIIKSSEAELMDPNIHTVLKYLRKNNIKFSALTARGSVIADVTIQKLNNLNISFSNSWLGTKGGIIFASGPQNKARILIEILKNNNLNPKKIIFIDDSLKNLLMVQETLEKLEIGFIGIRYSKIDQPQFKTDNLVCQKFLEEFPNLN